MIFRALLLAVPLSIASTPLWAQVNSVAGLTGDVSAASLAAALPAGTATAQGVLTLGATGGAAAYNLMSNGTPGTFGSGSYLLGATSSGANIYFSWANFLSGQYVQTTAALAAQPYTDGAQADPTKLVTYGSPFSLGQFLGSTYNALAFGIVPDGEIKFKDELTITAKSTTAYLSAVPMKAPSIIPTAASQPLCVSGIYPGSVITGPNLPTAGAVVTQVQNVQTYCYNAPSTPTISVTLNYTPTVSATEKVWVSNSTPATAEQRQPVGAFYKGTDQTLATQTAINYIHAQGGGTLYFPQGLYFYQRNTSPRLSLYSDIHLQGAGEFQSLLLDDDSYVKNQTTGVKTASVSLFVGTCGTYTGIDNVSFRDLTIRGTLDMHLNVNGGYFPIYINCQPQFNHNFVADHINMEYNKKGTIALGNFKNVIVSNSIFSVTNGGPGFSNTFDFYFLGNRVYGSGDDGFSSHSFDGALSPVRAGGVIANNIFEDTQGMNFQGGKNLVIENNIFKRIMSYGIYIGASAGTDEGNNSSESDNSIIGNTFEDVQRTSQLSRNQGKNDIVINCSARNPGDAPAFPDGALASNPGTPDQDGNITPLYGAQVQTFTGYISGTTLIAPTPSLVIGEQLSSAGLGFEPGTTIVSGSGGSYVVSISQTVGTSTAPVTFYASPTQSAQVQPVTGYISSSFGTSTAPGNVFTETSDYTLTPGEQLYSEGSGFQSGTTIVSGSGRSYIVSTTQMVGTTASPATFYASPSQIPTLTGYISPNSGSSNSTFTTVTGPTLVAGQQLFSPASGFQLGTIIASGSAGSYVVSGSQTVGTSSIPATFYILPSQIGNFHLNGSVGSSNAFPENIAPQLGCRNWAVANNKFLRTLPSTANRSLWGYGGQWAVDHEGASNTDAYAVFNDWDMPVPDADLTVGGVVVEGPLSHSTINHNVFNEGGVGILLTDYWAHNGDDDGLVIDGNIVENCGTQAGPLNVVTPTPSGSNAVQTAANSGCIRLEQGTTNGAQPAGTITNSHIVISNNYVDADDQFIARAASATSNGSWTAGGNLPCIYAQYVSGIDFVGNDLRDCAYGIYPMTTSGTISSTSTLTVEDTYFHNRLHGFWTDFTNSSTDQGIGHLPAPGVGYDYVWEQANPQVAGYGVTLFSPPTEASAMPTTGYWVAGQKVTYSGTTPSSGSIPLYYLRLTTGSGNVAGTDWLTVSAPAN